MSLHEFFEMVRHMALFTAVRESRYMYPIILSTHLSCIAVFGGLILVTDLRLLGLVLTRYSVASVVRQLRPWKWIGLTLMVTAGILQAGSKANIYYDNPCFIIKMCTLLLVGVHFLIFKSVYRDDSVPEVGGPQTTSIARIAGITSIVLWVGIVSMGRWIAYYDRPDDSTMLHTPYEHNAHSTLAAAALAIRR